MVKAGTEIAPEDLQAELVALVRAEIGAVVSLRQVDVVAALPKTRSGKILRKTMREIADGKTPGVPSTIEDPGCSTCCAPYWSARAEENQKDLAPEGQVLATRERQVVSG